MAKYPATNGVFEKFYGTLIILVAIVPLAKSKAHFELTSDQPGIIGSSITFTANLVNPDQPSYDIIWQEVIWEYGRSFRGVLNNATGYQSNWTVDYPDNRSIGPGSYSVTAAVSYQYLIFTVNVGTKIVYFNLTRDFTGTLDADQPGPKRKDPAFISTRNETQLLVNLHDPHGFLKEADNVTWTWNNQTGFMTNTSDPILKRNITKEGEYSFNVTLTAVFNASTTEPVVRQGFFQTKVIAKVPIVNFTVSGETWFPHGRLLNLRVLCDGSKPYSYCFQLKTGPYNVTGNETCGSPTVTNDCEIPFVWYFSDAGLHSLVIVMENDVSRVVNRTLINVYKVSKKQPLSIIIVPITCTLIALVMIIFGIAYFWENRAQFTVEVADFDFGHSDELPYMTFVERLKDAMTSTGATRQRLYHPPDDEPILSSRRASQFS